MLVVLDNISTILTGMRIDAHAAYPNVCGIPSESLFFTNPSVKTMMFCSLCLLTKFLIASLPVAFCSVDLFLELPNHLTSDFLDGAHFLMRSNGWTLISGANKH